MQNDKAKLKKQFKKRLYDFTLKLIEFLDKLPDNVQWFLDELNEVSSIFGSSILTLKGRK